MDHGQSGSNRLAGRLVLTNALALTKPQTLRTSEIELVDLWERFGKDSGKKSSCLNAR